jgi:hypothetical protein
MRRFAVATVAFALTASAAFANYCARDYVPAATLLVPYAVVSMQSDLSAPDSTGYTTLLSVTNVSSDAELIHVTVWSALSTPVVDFDEVLSGYDVWTINFRDLLTGHFDHFDTTFDGFWKGVEGPGVTPYGPETNQGFTSTLNGPYDTDNTGSPPPVGGVDDTGCNNPYGYHPEYGSGIIAGLANDIFPLAYEYADCDPTHATFGAPPWLKAIDTSKLWFYVTIDVVHNCNLLFPGGGSDYFADYASQDNVLIGEVVYLNSTQHYSEAMPAVHIEAQFDQGAGPRSGLTPKVRVGPSGNFYFIDRPSNDTLLYDTREPLATGFAFRYYDSGGVSSQLLFWKSFYEVLNTNYDQWSEGDTPAAWWACNPYVYYAWDENENSKTRSGGPSGFATPEPNVLPFQTQAAPLDPSNWTGLSANNGWVLLILDSSLPGVETYPFGLEGWAGVRYLFGGYSAGLEAATMANTNCFPGQEFPYLSYKYLYYNRIPIP